MHVKRLEIHGFKSFADKTIFELTPGVTVIVGPNGCGKSNITDAIRWVLGEQSARHLRGFRMEDIIFSGTSKRKALSFAEVSLTFDHSDGALGLEYEEITVTRRLYRNGESEYLLNKNTCRLKDILELFMDSGVGKEAYSFIGQGRVDEIINARPEERRQIFEEAAGILKYKSRKREAERRLAETAENLLRVGDIIHELSAQLPPLKEQAEQAQSYLQLREQLKAQEIDLLVHDALNLRQRWYGLDNKAKAAADDLIGQQTTVNRQEAELTTSQLLLDKEQTTVASRQQETQQLASEIEKAQAQIAVTKEKIHSAERQLKEASLYMEDLDQQAAGLTETQEQLAQQLQAINDTKQQAEAQLAKAQAALAELETSPDVQQSLTKQAELDKLLPTLHRLQRELDRVSMEVEQLEAQGEALAAQETVKQAEAKSLTEHGQALLRQKEMIRGAKEQQTSEQAELEQNLQTLQVQQEQLSRQSQQQQKELTATQNKLAVLQELEQAMAGYYQGVKTILKVRKKQAQLQGIVGTVADILQVPPRYVPAVEAALGASLQNLVAENEQVAKAAITYLKQTKGGRATFLPLNILEVATRRPASDKVTQIDGYLGIAADLVQTQPRFQQVIESLLGRVHFVANLDTALPAAQALHYRERVVTLDGDIIAPGGAMSGGFDKKQGGVLTRRKEAAALKEKLEQQQTVLLSLQTKEKSSQEQQAAAKQQLAELQQKLQQTELQFSLNEQEIVYWARQEQELTVTLQKLQQELTAVQETLSVRREVIKQTVQELTTVQKQEHALRIELAELEGRLSAREIEKQSLREHYTECRVRVASLQKQQERYADEADRARRERSLLENKKQHKAAQISLVQAAQQQLNVDIAAKQITVDTLQNKRSQAVAVLAKREQALKTMATELREHTAQLRQLEKSFAGLERKQARLEVERERVEGDLQAVLNRLRDSWELEFAEAEKAAKPLQDRQAAQTAISQIKESVNKLGTVNLGAIEEEQRVAERVGFLTTQRDDLREGERDLLRIIKEIDNRMGEKFASSFALINENFAQVFKELFGGGRAELCLIDPDNPLEAGVDIVAQPPGKKLQHLSLLSGGEKALTAISLLFAFLKMRPTPFCILDEIEAALDEANLSRFSDYLRTYSAQTQFILITHRKRTMEQADILYGVTMEESGVSKLISVRLRTSNNAEPNLSA
ncbi:MAG TPA: chromosome segregation protein SMC [Oscillospiraceae bacterium]|nr:chromosome segregation protein SMC [Oscillospiraceae bacterium]